MAKKPIVKGKMKYFGSYSNMSDLKTQIRHRIHSMSKESVRIDEIRIDSVDVDDDDCIFVDFRIPEGYEDDFSRYVEDEIVQFVGKIAG